MMVLRRPNGLRMFFAVRGSVLPHIAWNLALCTSLAGIVTIAHGSLFDWKVTLTPVPFTLIGLALAIFLGFRNGAAYDRYWEGRRLWGDVLHRARGLARQVQTLSNEPEPASWDNRSDPRTVLVLRTIGFAHALRHQLRDTSPRADLSKWLTDAEMRTFGAAHSGANHLLGLNGRDVGQLMRAGLFHPQIAAEIDGTLSALAAAAAGCERIKATPIPFAYTLLLHRTAYLYCFLLPFGLVDVIGLMTPFVVLIISYTFFGLDAVGNEIEDPFGSRPNHLPLNSICRLIEIDLLETLNSPHLPLVMQPIDGCLL